MASSSSVASHSIGRELTAPRRFLGGGFFFAGADVRVPCVAHGVVGALCVFAMVVKGCRAAVGSRIVSCTAQLWILDLRSKLKNAYALQNRSGDVCGSPARAQGSDSKQ